MHQQLPFKRTDRVGQQIKSILGEIVLKHISLNQIGFITFTSVDVSADLRNAKVFFSVLNPKIKIEAIENEMNKFRKAFRKYLGIHLNTKNTPKLKFYLDDSHKFTEEIDKLFKEMVELLKKKRLVMQELLILSQQGY